MTRRISDRRTADRVRKDRAAMARAELMEARAELRFLQASLLFSAEHRVQAGIVLIGERLARVNAALERIGNGG